MTDYVTTMTAGLMDVMTENGWLKLFPKMEGAIESIVRNAEQNKSYLRSILSKHPEWSEKDQAVVFELEDEVPKLNLNDAIYSYFNLARDRVRDMTDKVYQMNTFKHIANQRIWNEEGKLTTESSTLLSLVGIREAAGKKYSRALRAWGDSITDLKAHNSYERYYAQISDAICPTRVERKSAISINPMHFALMSNGNSWTSCHSVNKPNKSSAGESRPGGPLAFAQDATSILFFTLNKDCEELVKCPKITRQMFHYHGGTLIQQRVFPNRDSLESIKNYRKIMQSVIADCLNLSREEGTPEIANIWKCEKSCKHWTEPKDSFHYPDYERRDAGDYGSTSYLKGVSPEGNPAQVNIGHHCYCFNCGAKSKTHMCDKGCKENKK